MINLLLCFGWKIFQLGDAKGCYKQKSGYPEIVKAFRVIFISVQKFPHSAVCRNTENSSLAVVRGSGMETQFEGEIFQPPYFQIDI